MFIEIYVKVKPELSKVEAESQVAEVVGKIMGMGLEVDFTTCCSTCGESIYSDFHKVGFDYNCPDKVK
jgi:hypothetical protein